MGDKFEEQIAAAQAEGDIGSLGQWLREERSKNARLEQRAQRAEGLARYWKHWAENYAGQAQRAEAALREAHSILCALSWLDPVPEDRDENALRGLSERASAWVRKQNAAPPPEGEPDQYKHLGDYSAVEPWQRVLMSCDRCKVTWDGCWDNYQCPRCGEGELPWNPDDAPHTPQAHGDALAALERIKHMALSDTAGATVTVESDAETVRRHLTASGVPYVPENIRALPDHWQDRVREDMTAQDCADELERAIAAAPTDGRENE